MRMAKKERGAHRTVGASAMSRYRFSRRGSARPAAMAMVAMTASGASGSVGLPPAPPPVRGSALTEPLLAPATRLLGTELTRLVLPEL